MARNLEFSDAANHVGSIDYNKCQPPPVPGLVPAALHSGYQFTYLQRSEIFLGPYHFVQSF
jgi:hypothetical protein